MQSTAESLKKGRNAKREEGERVGELQKHRNPLFITSTRF